jgi:AcrR family transcriptional regulator
MTAAAEVFAERGLEVTLDDIATRAGLGVGTVYRRFADREALIEALFDEQMQQKVVRMREALTDPDPWQALIGFIRETSEKFASDRGLRQVALSAVHGHEQIARCRDEIHGLTTQLVARAKAQGSLRPDFQATDVFMIFVMVGAVADFAGTLSEDVWRRYLEMLIKGLRADGFTPEDNPVLSAKALEADELVVAMSLHQPAPRR